MMRSMLVLLALGLFVFGAPVLLADGDGGSAFDKPEEGATEEEVPTEPVPATYALKDYKLELKVADGRFWTHDKTYAENEEKANIILKLRFKLPKSESPFDLIVNARGWEHTSGFDFDGRKVSAAQYQTICEEFFKSDLEAFKDPKDIEKPRKVSFGKKRWKAYRYALTGQPSWSGGMPLRNECYFFKHKDKTYYFSVIMNTTAAKDERIVKELADLLASVDERVERRR